ncbi:hypothetical protein AAFC00_004338 [Neodothiora populina]|uniref:ASST-domain-containing protein n=1 Tax=Neodothiora populina TaxID=2781224 RepID=A0ABR3PJR5_9PEZI
MARSSFLGLISSAALLLQVASGQLNNDTSPTHQFKSRPDLHSPIVEIDLLRPELVAPGYIFVAPYRNVDPGPYIYDNYGNLVWSGAGSSGPKTAHAPHTCVYKGEEHLCYFQGEQHQGFARGHGVIMDNHYRIVKTVEASGAGASSDMHEFRITPYSDSKTALMTVYQPRMYDLTTNPRYRIKGGIGWIVEGVFQEIEIDTGRVVFEWRSADHLDPSLGYTMPATTDTSGDGLTENTPWDYFHINSIDKNEEGDYLISARHMAAIYKLSGKDGSVLWELGGANPTFEQTNFNFSSQHHARWLNENGTHTTLTFYDNASNGVNITDKYSRGYFITIDHVARTATAFKAYDAPEPEGGLLSGSQGNIQLLPNGNVHIGWGEHAHYSEHTADGSAVMYAKVAHRASNVMIYRSYKFPWIGQPLTKPALWTYSRTGDDASGMVFYVSWNGATEVDSWNFYASGNAAGPFSLVGNAKKDGFETVARYMNVTGWAFAEALDVEGVALERSVIAKTFLPSQGLREHCTDWGCGKAEHAGELDEMDFGLLETYPELQSPNRGYNTAQYYAELDPVEPRPGQGPEEQDIETGGSAILLIGAMATVFLAIMGLFMARRQVAASISPLREACANSRLFGKDFPFVKSD